MTSPNFEDINAGRCSFIGTVTKVIVLEADFRRATLSVSLENRHTTIEAIFEPSNPGDPLPGVSWGVTQLLFTPSQTSIGTPVTGHSLNRLTRKTHWTICQLLAWRGRILSIRLSPGSGPAPSQS